MIMKTRQYKGNNPEKLKDTGITRIDVHLENDIDNKRAKVIFRK